MDATIRQFIDPETWLTCRGTLMALWYQRFTTGDFPPAKGSWTRVPESPFQTVYTGPHRPLSWDLGHGSVPVTVSFSQELKAVTGAHVSVIIDGQLRASYDLYATATERVQPGIVDMLLKYGISQPSVLTWADVFAIVDSLATLVPEPA